MITVINIRDANAPCDHYIGRSGSKPSALANRWSHLPASRAVTRVCTREQAIACYRRWLWEVIQGEDSPAKREFLALCQLARTRDLVLGCHCKPLPCHGDVLARAITWFNQKEG